MRFTTIMQLGDVLRMAAARIEAQADASETSCGAAEPDVIAGRRQAAVWLRAYAGEIDDQFGDAGSTERASSARVLELLLLVRSAPHISAREVDIAAETLDALLAERATLRGWLVNVRRELRDAIAHDVYPSAAGTEPNAAQGSADWVRDVVATLPPLVGAKEAQTAIGVKRRLLNELVADRRLDGVRHRPTGGSRLLITRSSIERYLRTIARSGT